MMQSSLRLARCTRLIIDGKSVKKNWKRNLVTDSEKFKKNFPLREEFQARHIGPREHEQKEMLDTLGINVRKLIFFPYIVFSSMKMYYE